ncbi:MAG: HU family DNA-binding protein [Verrucomicrobiota bacterium]
MTYTKRDLIEKIAEKLNLGGSDVRDVIQMTLDTITAELAKGNRVELRNFGIFEVRISKPRVGRNPNVPEIDVPIPSRAMVKFKMGRVMRAGVKLGGELGSKKAAKLKLSGSRGTGLRFK